MSQYNFQLISHGDDKYLIVDGGSSKWILPNGMIVGNCKESGLPSKDYFHTNKDVAAKILTNYLDKIPTRYHYAGTIVAHKVDYCGIALVFCQAVSEEEAFGILYKEARNVFLEKDGYLDWKILVALCPNPNILLT